MEMSRICTLLEQHSIENIFTAVFTLIDDYIKVSQENARFRLPKATNQKTSYAQIMTIALVGELL